MASPAQIAANQANARKSTGPRSVEGKSASRFNALKHGIDAQSTVIPGEDSADYAALTEAYLSDYQPENVAEEFHVETMVRALWQKRRLQRLEADVTRSLLAQTPGQSLAAALLSESPAAQLLARTQRHIAAHERAWYRAHRELCRMRAQTGAAENRAFDKYLDRLCPPRSHDEPVADSAAELASFPQSATPPLASAKSTKEWPSSDPKTGAPLYFVG